jgi:ABC-type Fe3+ transport system substrate-binding protein
MRRTLRCHTILATLLVALVACAPAAPSSPATKQAAAGSTDLTNWDEIETAAKAEGVLVFTSTTGSAWQSFSERVKQAFPWLDVQWVPMKPSDMAPRVISEQRQGQYLWDMYFGATSNLLQVLTPADALETITPYLDVLPAELKDDSKWAGGFHLYTDPNKRVTLIDYFTIGGGFHVNREVAGASEIRTWQDLLDPKWKDKIIAYDPTVGNAGSFAYAALLASNGEDFVKKLVAQSRYLETRSQVTEFVIQGRYPVAIGLDDDLHRQFLDQGVGKSVELVGRDTSPYLLSNGISIFKNTPHPNVSKMVLRWLLSAEGQDARASSVLNSSRRLDVKSYDPLTSPDYSRLNEFKFRLGTTDGEEITKKTLELTKQK